MIPFLYNLVRPILFLFEPEKAHYIGFKCLKIFYQLAQKTNTSLFFSCNKVKNDSIQLMGFHFPHRVGLAAGLDKNAEYLTELFALGFAFVEVGTVTPLAQPGNAKPRLFRLKSSQALINRLGFNNHGISNLLNNIKKSNYLGILGINIGKNASTPMENAINDYIFGLEAVYKTADYITINISSPNTKNLRQLQEYNALGNLLQALNIKRNELAIKFKKQVPLVLKIAPDLTHQQVLEIAYSIKKNNIDGIIATNTTLQRCGVENHPLAIENGGLSGAPVLAISNKIIKQFREALGPDVVIIGAGGIMNYADAQSKIDAGADLIQIYTGLIYRGPSLIQECQLIQKNALN